MAELSRCFFVRPFGLLVHDDAAAGGDGTGVPSGLLFPVLLGPKKLSHQVLRPTDRRARPTDAWSEIML